MAKKPLLKPSTTSDVPPWLEVMRMITGVEETAGDADNPKILAMRDEIARIYPEMSDYCDEYQHDETPWCGLAAAFCMAEAGVRPPFGIEDTDRFLWAQAWADDPQFSLVSSPTPGTVVVLTRSGGGHVTFYERTSGSNYICRGGNQSDAVNEASFPKSSVIALVWPSTAPRPPVPPADRPVLEEGDSGPEVAAVQNTLGIPADGDFGPVTEGAVKGFQAACNLDVDGVVGPNTWKALDDLDARKASGGDGLSADTIAKITASAEASAIAKYSWRDRGKMPIGYTTGVALCYALALTMLDEGDPAAEDMAQADREDPNTDALSWYHSKFAALGIDTSVDGVNTLRALFVLIMGLGPRESSGRYCEGRDMSASNVSSDTAEAGMFQTSWNIRSCSSHIPPLLSQYWDNPNGFLSTFRDGVEPDSNDLQNYGSGGGAQYQFLSKYAPAFHALVTALGLRHLRQHWGPINRNEVELRNEAEDLLLDVEDIIDQEPITPPVPEVPTITVNVNPAGSARVVVVGAAE